MTNLDAAFWQLGTLDDVIGGTELMSMVEERKVGGRRPIKVITLRKHLGIRRGFGTH